MEGFIKWIRKLRGHPTMTPAEAEAYYSKNFGMISTLIARNSARPFFVTEWTDPRIGDGHLRVPTKLAYLLTRDSAYVEQEFPEYQFRPWRNRVDPYVVKVSEIYTTSLLAGAAFSTRSSVGSLSVDGGDVRRGGTRTVPCRNCRSPSSLIRVGDRSLAKSASCARPARGQRASRRPGSAITFSISAASMGRIFERTS